VEAGQRDGHRAVSGLFHGQRVLAGAQQGPVVEVEEHQRGRLDAVPEAAAAEDLRGEQLCRLPSDTSPERRQATARQ
jgi:hypothetical protein